MYRKDYFPRQLDSFIVFLKKLLDGTSFSNQELEKYSQLSDLDIELLTDITNLTLSKEKFEDNINLLEEDYLKEYLRFLIQNYNKSPNPFLKEIIQNGYSTFLKKSKNLDLFLDSQIQDIVS